MKLTGANLCVEPDCEEIFNGQTCPSCAATVFLPLTRAVKPLQFCVELNSEGSDGVQRD